MTELINLTPHSIIVNGVEISPSGDIARVGTTQEIVNSININGIEIPIYRTKYNEVQVISNNEVKEFPAPKEGTLFIVSSIVKSALPNRNDVVVPTDFIRDEKGNIIGCKGFSI